MRTKTVQLICILCGIAGVIACRRDPVADPADPKAFPNCRLLSCSYESGYSVYRYEYDNAGRLITRFELRKGIVQKWINFRYSDKGLTAREYWSQYAPDSAMRYQIDTLLYNTVGQIKEVRQWKSIHNFTGPDIRDYSYDENGLPVESRRFFKNNTSVDYSYKYTWENGNLTKIEYFAGEFGAPMFVFDLTYASGLNYKRLASDFPEEPEYNSRNLVRQSKTTDYTGLLDPLCNPCKNQYKLNRNHLPLLIIPESGNPAILEWDCR